MFVTIVEGALAAVAIYLAIGALVALPFLTIGIGRVDQSARGAPWTFRILVLPGVVAMWPLVIQRWLSARRIR